MFDHALPIWIGGGLAALLAGMVASSRRTLGSLVALAAVVLVTLALLAVERAVVTPAEQLEQAVGEILAAIEANDVQGVLALVDHSAAGVRRDVETLMGVAQADKCHAASSVRVQWDDGVEGEGQATTSFKGMFNGISRNGGARLAYFDQVDIRWRRSGDEGPWRMVGYTAYRDGQPLDAVESARGARFVPGR
jgi:hypothetical protein